MDKKASRLRYSQYDDTIHIFQLPIDKELFIKFKAQCVNDGLTMRDKLTSLVKSSLSQ